MASEAELLALASRVERSLPWEVDNSPHFHNMRALDLEIARSVGWDSAQSSGRGDRYGIPAYTASLDAAMTLVPEGRWWSVNGGNRADVWASGYIDERWHATAATPALALTAAALRARAATMGGSDD